MAGIDAFGTTLEIDDGTTGDAYDAYGEITSIDILDASVDDYDVTTHSSPDQWREFIGGLKDGGSLSVELNFDPALHGALLELLGVTRNFKITLPADADSAEVTFTGYLNSMSSAAPHDGLLEAEVGIKVSGKPTLTIP